ncbi:MAG: UbiA family prenyltransferase [Clostridiales bacterium]|nr:UbiA family prenyltransferase [Clostridiales bacterium]
MKAYVRALRLERWPRSTAILLGSAGLFFLHHDFLEFFSLPTIFSRLLFAFFLTWGISTANYVINEIVDVPYDAHHPVKRHRPLVKGEISKTFFILVGIALSLSCLGLAAAAFSRPFFLALLSLLAAGFVYNIKPIRTKDIPFLDAISESANNPIRFLIGWYAFSPPQPFPPLSLLISWWSFGAFLMEAKRLSEFRLLKENAANYRASHKKYSRTSLLAGMVASAVVFMASYVYFALSQGLPFLLYASPLLLLYLYLFFHKTLREKEIMEEPETLLLHPLIALFTLVLLFLFALAFFL